jgi:hypothetical protein
VDRYVKLVHLGKLADTTGGQVCKMVHLGKLADTTGGQVCKPGTSW